MAETLSGHPLGEIISRFIGMLSKDPAFQGASQSAIEAEALKRAKEAMDQRSAARKNAENQERARKSKEWAEKVKSKDGKTHDEALKDAEKAYADGLTLKVANEHLAQTETVLNVKAPAWLKTNIQECPEAVELIARVTQLPSNLQENPNVLYAELAKMNKSMKWSESSPDARKEARVVQDKVLARIHAVAKNDCTFGDLPRDALLDAIDPGTIHLKTITDIKSAGVEPGDKNSPEYKQWEAKKIAEGQAKHLQNTIDTFQDIFDLPDNQPPDNQREQLEQLIKDLRNGITKGQRINGVEGYHAGFNRAQAMEYIESAQAKLNLRKDILNEQHEKQYGEKITLGDLRKTDWFTGDEISKSTKKLGDEVSVTLGRHWSPQDVNYLREHGYEKWFYRYVDRVFGLGMERKQPSLAQQYIYEDFQNFLITFYGGNESSIILTRFQTLWEERSRYDYIVHSIGLGPGDMKRRLEAMSMLTAADLDYLNTFKYSELANTFMERETFSLMGEKLAEYEKSVKWLEEKNTVHNDYFSIDKHEVAKELNRIYPDKSPEDIEKILKLYGEKDMSRKDYLKILKAEKIIQSDSGEFVQKGHRRLLDDILSKSDSVARGVVLEDIDVWGYSDIEIHLVKVSEEIARLKRGRQTPKEGEINPVVLTSDEITHYDVYVNELGERQQRLLQKKLAKVHEMEQGWGKIDDDAKLINALAERKGLSHIEVRVYERMREYLRAKTGEYPDEMELRQSIWAARTEIIGTGRMAAIGAMMARTPGSGGYETGSGKHVMMAPAFEDLVRTMNVEMFASRFKMGGEMGDVMRAYLRFNLRQERIGKTEVGVDKPKSFFETSEWKEMKRGIQNKTTKESVRIMEFAEKDLGIKFSELLAPGFMATGGQFDGTSWRLDAGVLDAIRLHYLKLMKDKPGAIDNQALAIRYLIADGPVARKQVLEKMMKRTPTKFFSLLADQRESMMTEVGLSATDETWYRFENALKYAETDLWRDKKYIFEDINLATKTDFDKIVKPYLTGAADADIEKYRKLIGEVQNRLTSTGLGHAEYKTYLDGLAQEKLPLTLSLDDFDWRDTDMKTLGNLAFPRRVRDIGGMDEAKNIILGFISNKDNILSPHDVKESLKQLLALKTAINSYSPTETAEKAVKQLSRLLIEFNRDRSLWSAPSFSPGGKALGLRLAEMDLRPDAPYRGKFARGAFTIMGKVGEFTLGNIAKASSNFKPLESALNWMMPGWKGFSKEPFEHWPHSIAEAISWSTRFSGAGGNHWGERQINEVLHEMETMGLYTDHREFIHDLRGEFKAGFGWNVLAVARRYWWVVPVATIAFAFMSQAEEEKKGHH